MSFDLPKLPEHWQYVALEKCCAENSVTYGVVQPGSALLVGRPIIRVNNFRDTQLDVSDVMHISPEIEAKHERTRLKGGEVLLTIVGSVGQVAVAPPHLAGFNVARAVAVLHPLPHVQAEWIALCLRSPLSQRLLGSRANTTVQTTINLRDLRALPIAMPSGDERREISSFLGVLDDRISLLRETNATLEAIAQALFKSWFVDFDPVRAKRDGRAPEGMDEATAALFPDSLAESKRGPIPLGWRVGSFLEIAELLSGGTPKTDRTEYWGGGIPWASARDVSQSTEPALLYTERTITPKGLKESSTRIVPAMATVVVARGATTGRMVFLGNEMAMNQTCYALTSKFQAPIALHLLLRREIGALVGAAHGSVFDTITTSTFSQSKVVLAPVELVKRFEELVDPLYRKIVASVRAAQVLTAIRNSLLPRLISGQLRLQELQSEADEAITA